MPLLDRADRKREDGHDSWRRAVASGVASFPSAHDVGAVTPEEDDV